MASDASLDIARSGDTYELVVRASDGGRPHPKTGEATVVVFVVDVNDKKPKFEYPAYTAYVLESSPPGTPVVQAGSSNFSTIVFPLIPKNSADFF